MVLNLISMPYFILTYLDPLRYSFSILLFARLPEILREPLLLHRKKALDLI